MAEEHQLIGPEEYGDLLLGQRLEADERALRAAIETGIAERIGELMAVPKPRK